MALAVGFTGLLNATILSLLVWPEWLPERVKLACGLATGLIWLAAVWETRGELRRQAARLAEESLEDGELAAETEREVDRGALDQLFCEAQRHYLAGDWLATERSLVRLLRQDRHDIEAQLLLATLFRSTGETAKARRALDRLARRADAVEWLFEVNCEQRRLDSPHNSSSQNDAA